jgi:hypothetical protein
MIIVSKPVLVCHLVSTLQVPRPLFVVGSYVDGSPAQQGWRNLISDLSVAVIYPASSWR